MIFYYIPHTIRNIPHMLTKPQKARNFQLMILLVMSHKTVKNVEVSVVQWYEAKLTLLTMLLPVTRYSVPYYTDMIKRTSAKI